MTNEHGGDHSTAGSSAERHQAAQADLIA